MNQRITNLAQIGCGYWGPNLLRNFSALPQCRVKYLVDTDAERRAFVERSFPGTTAISDSQRIWADPEIDAVIVATPAGSHFEIAREALRAGKHVFVEKPLATRVSEVDTLAALAKGQGLIVMVGHTFLFNSAVRYIKDLIDSGSLGDVRYIYSQRLNLGRIRSDIDALWNFGPHDISIVQYWLGNQEPTEIARHGVAYVQPGVDDVVFLNIAYPKKVMVNIHVSWLDPQKVRKIVVVGSKKMVVYDDMADEKVVIYDKGIDLRARLGEKMDYDRPVQTSFHHRSGDIHIPRIDLPEPLRVEAEHFIHCVQTGAAPLTDIRHARGVISILEKATPTTRAA
jgi:predicted dehydrogenase